MSNKRIGILTYFTVPNFGAQLQVLSTVNYFKNNGFIPFVINWYPKDLEEQNKMNVDPMQLQIHYTFARDNLPLTSRCFTDIDIVNTIKNNKIESIFIGSDAVMKWHPFKMFWISRIKNLIKIVLWKLNIIKYKNMVVTGDCIMLNPYQGSFLKHLNRRINLIMFSASSQGSNFSKMSIKEVQKVRTSLEKFSYISARDIHTKKMFDYILNTTDIPITPDPVFCFNSNIDFLLPTRNDILSKFNLPEKYILVSFRLKCSNVLNDLVIELCDKLEKEGLTPYALPHPEGMNSFSLVKCISLPLSPIDWYSIIKYSSGYIGERMHPIIVSIHNNIPFFVFDEYAGSSIHNSKIFNLLASASLEDCYYSYRNLNIPEAEFIVDRIINFSKESELRFARQQEISYKRAMNDILMKLK